MTVNCPACGLPNPGGSVQCIRCGASMPTASTSNFSGYGRQQQAMYQQPVQMGAVNTSLAEDPWQYRRAFAGYGIPISHHSWLLDGEYGRAAELRNTIIEILRQRSFIGFNIDMKNLKERGYQTEDRGYIVAQRGVSTVFIYVAPAGKDLYISRVTSVRPLIDIFRVISLCILVGVAVFGPGIITSIAASSGNPAGYMVASVLASLVSLISIPIWIYLLVLIYRSFRYWLAERDFFVYLRSRVLNDFQLDDIALLEHATDDTVLSAVKQLNMDASKIVPPAMGYRPERHVRAL